jgi:hypothetical protein
MKWTPKYNTYFTALSYSNWLASLLLFLSVITLNVSSEISTKSKNGLNPLVTNSIPSQSMDLNKESSPAKKIYERLKRELSTYAEKVGIGNE